jgi:hypothetical protein
MSFIKIIILYLIFFVLFYIEPISIGSLKFAIIWKLPLVVFLGAYFFLKLNKVPYIPTFIFIGILLSFKILFSLSSLEYINSTISEFTKLIIFFFTFIYLRNRYNLEELKKFGKYTAIFVILSFIPFLLNILKPLGKSIELSKYGTLDISSLTGIFQNPHSAGITLAISLIVIYYYILNSIQLKEKLVYLMLFLGGTIEMILTFVRTPMVILITGLAVLSFKYFKLKHIIYSLIILLLASTYVYVNIENSVLLKSLEVRIQGENKYNSTGGIGSGRIMFWEQSIKSWQSEGFLGLTMGLGIELAKDKMEKGTGLRLFAHNGFLEQLQSDGLIGFLLLISLLYYIYVYIRKYKESPYYILALAIYSGYIVYIFFQGGNYFLFYVIFSTYLVILQKTAIKNNLNE